MSTLITCTGWNDSCSRELRSGEEQTRTAHQKKEGEEKRREKKREKNKVNEWKYTSRTVVMRRQDEQQMKEGAQKRGEEKRVDVDKRNRGQRRAEKDVWN